VKWNLTIIHVHCTKKISKISMYYVKTRADNSGYTNHRVTCLVVMGSPFDKWTAKVSIWNLVYLFTIKRGTNYNKADDPVICISRVICPCFDIVHRNLGYFFSIIKIFDYQTKPRTEHIYNFSHIIKKEQNSHNIIIF
jgi:hypothetical protein